MSTDKKIAPPEATSIRTVLQELIEQIGDSRQTWESKIISAWQNAVGDRAVIHTRVMGLRRQTLVVAVDSSPWLYLLSLYKRKILSKLERLLPEGQILEIQFKTGKVNET